MSCHSLLAYKVIAKKSPYRLIEFFLNMTSYLSLAGFKILFLFLTSHVLIITYLGVTLFEFIFCDSSCILNLDTCSFYTFMKVFSHYSSSKFSVLFSLFSSWEPYKYRSYSVWCFLRSLKLSSSIFFSFLLFSFWCSGYVPNPLSSSSLTHSSVSSSLLVNPSSVFFSSVFIFFSGTFLYFPTHYWSFHCIHPFFFWDWWASSWPWITFFLYLFKWCSLFTFIIVRSFSEILYYSFIWNIFFFFFILHWLFMFVFMYYTKQLSLSLEGETLFGDEISHSPLSYFTIFLSNLCVCLNNLIYSWYVFIVEGVLRRVFVPTWRISFCMKLQADWKPDS